jgi:hypothetical protein
MFRSFASRTNSIVRPRRHPCSIILAAAIETLIYHLWNTSISNSDMSLSTRTPSLKSPINANILYRQFRLPRIIIGAMKGNVSAVSILKEGLSTARDLGIEGILLALGPTSPLSLGCSSSQKILWATFLHDMNVRNVSEPTVVPPTRLTDLSVSFEKLCWSQSPVRFLLGDFLDSVLSVSTDSDAFAFLSNLLTRIRENEQTAFFLLTEDMHDTKKITMVKRFADVVIEYRENQEDDRHQLETRILDLSEGYTGDWQMYGASHTEQHIDTTRDWVF